MQNDKGSEPCLQMEHEGKLPRASTFKLAAIDHKLNATEITNVCPGSGIPSEVSHNGDKMSCSMPCHSDQVHIGSSNLFSRYVRYVPYVECTRICRYSVVTVATEPHKLFIVVASELRWIRGGQSWRHLRLLLGRRRREKSLDCRSEPRLLHQTLIRDETFCR